MPIYDYETIPQKEGEKPIRFEYKQGMNDEPLTVHPETGQPVRRVYSAFSVGGSYGGGDSCGCGGTCGCGH